MTEHILEVTVKMVYIIPDMNGIPIDERIENWFIQHPLNQYHAARDFHKVGFSERLISIKKLEKMEEYNKDAKPIIIK